uniref:Uncharacterized protein n=1 Tax=Cacopsylla melanoneura TaxID=428564 RepID=A0A8D8TIF3_9HEMI
MLSIKLIGEKFESFGFVLRRLGYPTIDSQTNSECFDLVTRLLGYPTCPTIIGSQKNSESFGHVLRLLGYPTIDGRKNSENFGLVLSFVTLPSMVKRILRAYYGY